MNIEFGNMVAAVPELWLLVIALLILMTAIFFPNRRSLLLFMAQFSLIAIGLFTLFGLNASPVMAFSGLFVADSLAALFKLFLVINVFLALTYGYRYIQLNNMAYAEYIVLTLLSLLGMFILVSANSLLTVYLGLELISLPLYVLIALKKDSLSIESAIKYFVTGAIASAILLFGMSLLYGATGTLAIDKLAAALSALGQESHLITEMSFVFILLAIAFKLALVPVHMWAPDVYDGAPNAIVTFLSSAPKLAALSMLFRLAIPVFSTNVLHFQTVLIALAMLSIALGNLFAVSQTNIKKLLAYSGIGHMGFILLGIIAGSKAGYAASMFYAITYSLTAVAMFGGITLLSHHGFELREVSDLSDLNSRHPWLAFLFLMLMLSMAGVPPMVGFVAKLLVLKSLVDVHMMGLVIWGLIFTVIGAYYYLRVIKQMYFGEKMLEDNTSDVSLSFAPYFLLSVNAISLLVLGLVPATLLYYCVQVFM